MQNHFVDFTFTLKKNSRTTSEFNTNQKENDEEEKETFFLSLFFSLWRHKCPEMFQRIKKKREKKKEKVRVKKEKKLCVQRRARASEQKEEETLM